MLTSQNGRPVLDNDDHNASIVVNGVIFGGGTLPGPVNTVLTYVAQRFHNEVEALVPGDCGGFNRRKIKDKHGHETNVWSNHASGTAIDCNGSKHPQGSADTFHQDGQVTAIRAILDDCDKVVRWGGDFHNSKDEMHFEIVGDDSAVQALADKIGEDDLPMNQDDFNKLMTAWANSDAGKKWRNDLLGTTLGASTVTVAVALQNTEFQTRGLGDKLNQIKGAIH